MHLRVRIAVFFCSTCVVAVSAVLAVREVGSSSAQKQQSGFAGALRPANIPPSPFRLRDDQGHWLTLNALRGKVVIASFLYTTCQDTCPLTAQQIRGALDQLGERKQVAAIAFSVDPARDNAQNARRFLIRQQVTGRIHFLLGSRQDLQPQWKAYGIQPQGKNFDHTAHIVLLDRNGVQRVGFPVDQLTPERLAHDVRLLLAN